MKESIIAPGLTIEGKIIGKGHVRVAGRFKGDIQVEGNLHIDADAKVEGQVKANEVIISGELQGNIESAKHVELRQGGTIHGDVKAGSLTVGIVTRPFLFEGRKRMRQAELGIAEMRKYVDTMIVVPNERLLAVVGKGIPFQDALKKADEVLLHATQGISSLISVTGLVNVDFADVRTVMQEGGSALMGTGIGRGDNRATEAAQQAIASPLLDNVSIAGATGVLLNITGGPDMTLGEVYQISEIIHDAAGSDAEIIFGAVHEPAMGGEIRVTVIATGFDSANNSAVSGGIISQGQGNKGSPVIPFPAQRQAGAARVTRGIQAGTGTDGLRRVTQSPAASSLQDKQIKQDVQDQDLADMEIPTFIRRQMD